MNKKNIARPKNFRKQFLLKVIERGLSQRPTQAKIRRFNSNAFILTMSAGLSSMNDKLISFEVISREFMLYVLEEQLIN